MNGKVCIQKFQDLQLMAGKAGRLFFVLVIASFICFFSVNDVSAAEKTVNVALETTLLGEEGDSRNYAKEIDEDINNLVELDDNTSELKETSTVTLTVDNPEIAMIAYYEEVYKNKNKRSKGAYKNASNVTFTGKQLKYVAVDSEEDDISIPAGTWITEVSLIANKKGTANVTMTVDNSGIIETWVYHITIKGAKPRFAKKLTLLYGINEGGYSNFSMYNIENAYLELHKLSDVAKVTMSCNKSNALTIYPQEKKKQKVKLKKNMSAITAANKYVITSQKTGTFKLTVKVEQDGKSYSKTYPITVDKYKNPFQSFTIGGKNYAKYFKNARVLVERGAKTERGECAMTYKDAKGAWGGKPFRIRMRSGYKLVKVSYRSLFKDGGVKLHRCNSKLPDSFWELHITYKDSKGKTRTNLMWYTVAGSSGQCR